MSTQIEKRCQYCGRLRSQVKRLTARRKVLICEECEQLYGVMYGSSSQDIPPQTLRDPEISDEYKRFQIEKAVQSELRKKFNTSVDEPKDPAEKERLRALSGNDMGQGMQAHPVLKNQIQFNGINETLQLPTMDPEQQEKYLEHQLQLQNTKRLQHQNEASMKPTPLA